MAGKPLARADLSEAVYQKGSLSQIGAAGLVEQVLSEVGDTLVRGDTVKLPGFGTFTVRSKGERVRRNPNTGVEVPIEQCRVMVFKPSKDLKAQINGEAVERED